MKYPFTETETTYTAKSSKNSEEITLKNFRDAYKEYRRGSLVESRVVTYTAINETTDNINISIDRWRPDGK